MSVSDRWHRSRPGDDEPRCREHDMVPSPEHGKGPRWQVRYRDDAGRQRKKNFPKKNGTNPNEHAAAFDVKIREQLATDTYFDPSKGRITFREYAEQWRAGLVTDPNTIAGVTSALMSNAYPRLGDQAMANLARRPSLIQQWIKAMEADGRKPSTIKVVVGWVSTVFNAAVDDGVVSRNPCAVRSVRRPRIVGEKPVPWDLARVDAVANALPTRYAELVYLGAGCGHRQGELFGVAVDDVDFLGRTVHVRRQVRIVAGRLVFSLPKGGKTRDVPLPDTVGMRLAAHIREYPPTPVTLPWKTPDGEPVTARLLFTPGDSHPVHRTRFNEQWRAALDEAGVPRGGRKNGCHVLRHSAASAWLAAGVDIRTVAEFLGHTDPGFTLRTYEHMMPNAADRARKAMDAFFSTESAPIVPSEVQR